HPEVTPGAKPASRVASPEIEDGRRAMHKLFVESKMITTGDFDLCWPVPDLSTPPKAVIEPFIQLLSEKGILHVDKSLKLLSDKFPCHQSKHLVSASRMRWSKTACFRPNRLKNCWSSRKRKAHGCSNCFWRSPMSANRTWRSRWAGC